MASLLFKGTVDEIDVGKIVEGMDAEIQIGALPDTKIPGRVDRIFPKAKKEGNATLFDIGFIKDTAGVTLRAGLGQHPDPRAEGGRLSSAVLFEDGKKFVEIPTARRRRRSRSDAFRRPDIEILDGIKEGD
jgi:HlyD family secretion protein